MGNFRGIFLSLLSIATTASGLLGQILLFRHFDASTELDLYYYSLAIPSFLAGQISLILGYYLVPFLSQHVHATGQCTFQTKLMHLLVVSCLVMAIPGMAVSLLMAQGSFQSLTSNIGDPLPWLIILSWTSVLVANLNAAQTAFLNVRLSFVLPALFPLITQSAMVVSLILFSDKGIVSPLVGLNVGGLIAWVLGSLALRQAKAKQKTTNEGFNLLPEPNNATLSVFLRRVTFLPFVLCIFSAHFFIDALVSRWLATGELSSLALVHRLNIGAVGIVVAAFAGPMTVELSQLASHFELRQVALVNYLKRLSIYGSAVCAIVFCNASGLIELLTGSGVSASSEQLQMVDLLHILAFAGVPMLLGQFLLRALLVFHLHRKAAIAAGIWGLIYLIGAWCSAMYLGAIGLATTYLASWAALAVWSIRALGQPIRIYDFVKTFSAVLIIGISALLGREVVSLILLPSWFSLVVPICLSTATAGGAALLIDKFNRKKS